MSIKPNMKPQQSIHQRIFAAMHRMNIEANPVNFEIFHEILTGANPELRERFVKLGKNISSAQMEELGREFLPHHYGEAIFDKSATAIQDDLESLLDSIGTSSKELESYASQLSQSSRKIQELDPKDAASIKKELDGLVSITDQQKTRSHSTMGMLNGKLESVRSMRAEVEDVQAAKFRHVATGLGNRRAFNKRMASLFSDGAFPGEYTLLFGKVSNLGYLDSQEYFRVKEALLERIGKSVMAITSDEDFGAWIDEPQIAILLNTASESEVERLSQQVSRQIRSAINGVQNQMSQVPLADMNVFFGASTTYSAQNAANMIKNSETALLNAVSSKASETIIFGQTSSHAAEGRDYSLYASSFV